MPGSKPTRTTAPRGFALEHLQSALESGVRGEARRAILEAIRAVSEGPRKHLTDLEYAALKPGAEIIDRDRPGFLARANKRGTRFMYRFRHPDSGKQTEQNIGYLNEIGLADARKAWEQLRAQRMGGSIPAIKAPVSTVLPTIADLVDSYLKDYAQVVKRPRSEQEDRRQLQKHVIPKYGHLTADQFGYDAVAGLLAGLQSTPVEARKLRATLSTLFNVGAGRTTKLVIANPKLPRDFPNPVTSVVLRKESRQTTAPSDGEIRRYLTALRTVPTIRQDFRDMLIIQALLASRIREVCEMEWSEINLDDGTWRLPAARSKNKQEHVVFLPEEAIAILRRRAAWKAPKDTFVFPMPSSRFHEPGARPKPLRVDQVQHVIAANREALGVGADFTSHKVRHAFSTWAGENNYAVETVNRCTAHVVAQGINRVYNAARLNGPARALWNDWATFLR